MLLSNHKEEWRSCAVASKIIELNVYFIKNNAVLERFLANINIPKVHKDAAWRYICKPYKPSIEIVEIGGWFVVSVGGFSCYKPDKPRIDQQGKVVKSKPPCQTKTTLFLINPGSRWTDIATLSNVSRKRDDFWKWAESNPSVLIVLTKGANKAGTLLCLHYVAIALSWGETSSTTPKNNQEWIRGKSFLIHKTERVAVSQRAFYFTIDQKTKQKSPENVNKALLKAGELISQKGCTAKAIEWQPSKGKGVDDFIAQNGASEFYRAYDAALTLEKWNAKSFSRLTYPANITINQRYLRNLFVPEQAKLTCRKFPKGTGKTQGLKIYVEEAIRQSLPTLVIGCAFGYPIFSIKLGRNGRSGCGVWGVGCSEKVLEKEICELGVWRKGGVRVPILSFPHTPHPTPYTLLNSHRVQLAEVLCDRSSIPYTRPPTPCPLDESWEMGFAN